MEFWFIMKVAIVHNEPLIGMPDSEDVTDEVAVVAQSLQEIGYDFKIISVKDKNSSYSLSESVFSLLLALKKYSPDVIFNLVEGLTDAPGYQHHFSLMFEFAGYSFTGSRHEAILTTTDKGLCKKLMNAFQISTPPYQEYRREKIKLSIPLLWLVKPALEDASVGIDDYSLFTDEAKLNNFLPEIHKRYNKQPIIIEHYIDGREFNISLLETEDGIINVLPIAEIIFHDWPKDKPKIIGYKAKWDRESFEYKNTLRQFNPYDAPLSELSYIALKCWKIFKLSGYARIDMRMDKERNIFVIDVNANPCIAPDSGFIAAAKEGGYEAKDVIKEIIDAAYIYSKKSKKDLLKHHI